MGDALPQDTFDLAARMLRKYTHPQELHMLITAHQRTSMKIQAAIPSRGLPGIGAKFWHKANEIKDKTAADQTLASGYRRVDPLEGNIITQPILKNMYEQWQRDVCTQLTSITANAKYNIEPNPEIGLLGGHPVIMIKLRYLGQPRTWQNGNPKVQPSNCNIWWHATRSALVPSIMADGLKSTIVSHGYKGLWVNTHAPSALVWTINMLDPFPTVAFQLEIQKDILVHNSEVQAGNVHRSVACTEPDQQFPNLQIQALAIRIPTTQHRHWALGLRQAMLTTVIEATQYQESPTPIEEIQNKLFREVWHMTTWRLCYHGAEGSMDITFGGPFCQVSQFSANLSLTITEIVAGLKAKNTNTRLKHFYNVPLEAIPGPIMKWLSHHYPGIDSLFNPVSPPAVADGSIWNFTITLQVKPWKVVKYDLHTDLWI